MMWPRRADRSRSSWSEHYCSTSAAWPGRITRPRSSKDSSFWCSGNLIDFNCSSSATDRRANSCAVCKRKPAASPGFNTALIRSSSPVSTAPRTYSCIREGRKRSGWSRWRARPAGRPSDRAAVRRLCCQTGFLGEPIDPVYEDHELFADFLTTYYTDKEPESSFVLEVDGEIRGYLLGSRKPLRNQFYSFRQNFRLFLRTMRRYHC